MLAGPNFLSPTELLTRAPLGSIARAEIPGKFRGKIGPVVHTGTSTGTISFGGYPIDAYSVVLRCVVSGDIGVAQFQVSLDGGATFDDPDLSDPNTADPVQSSPTFGQNVRWTFEIGITGITFLAINGSGTPNSFIAGDSWTFTTTASPKLLSVCGQVSDFWRKWAQNTAQVITTPDEADLTFMSHIARVWLTSDRGDIPEGWLLLYKEAREHFKLEAQGDIRLNSIPDPDSLVFADFERARRPFSTRYWRH